MKRTEAMQDFVDTFTSQAFGISNTEAKIVQTCVFCKGDANQFRDPLSKKEYGISGLCQTCQDEVFGV